MLELADQRRNIKLIASENYSSLATQCAMGNLLTDKYAEGIPHHRFYAGCDNVDSVEDLANTRARELFGAAHAYAQPHSGADANLVAFWAILRARVELPAMVDLLKADGPGARPRGLVQAEPRTMERGSQADRQPAFAGDGTRLGRAPHTRLPAELLGQDVRVPRVHG